MKRTIKWGIMGPGMIAHRFAESLKSIDGVETVAVGSRSRERAAEFASQFGICKAYGDYGSLASDPDIDVIYIATPHPAHYECSLTSLEAGKSVLCEKPLTINAKEAERLITAAKSKGLFFMEAMWSRFLPVMVKVRELLAQGALGEVRIVRADFGFRCEMDPKSRLFDPVLGGGSLLDLGVYDISFASMVLGPDPLKITGVAHLGETGVDEQCSLLLGYKGGKIADLSAANRTLLPNDAWILGTEGNIRIPEFWCARSFDLIKGDKVEHYELPFISTGFTYEAEEASRCIREGRIESAVMPMDESLKIMRIMDELRRQWGFKYPFE